MVDSSRRTVLATGAAAAAAATAAPQVFAQAPQAATPQALPAGLKIGFYEKGNVRIRYGEIGSGFPLLATPGGGLNSRMGVWPNAVINIPEAFKNDFRIITMDQRNASGGESTGPVPVDKPWDAFADDQLGLMDHLGIRQFFFFGNCIGGPFAMKLMQRAPQRRWRPHPKPLPRMARRAARPSLKKAMSASAIRKRAPAFPYCAFPAAA